MKIVRPTIIDPWREQIESAKTLKRLGELRERLHHFRVLDPACGSGNFLYIAYRELKRLEARLIERINEFPSRAEPEQRQISFLSVQNFYGLDINPLAVEIAKVSMMIARKLAIDELHITERALPLDNLDHNFIAADALIDADGKPVAWPKADVIIGNPPFTGAKLLKPQRGPDYVNAVAARIPTCPAWPTTASIGFAKHTTTYRHAPPPIPSLAARALSARRTSATTNPASAASITSSRPARSSKPWRTNRGPAKPKFTSRSPTGSRRRMLRFCRRIAGSGSKSSLRQEQLRGSRPRLRTQFPRMRLHQLDALRPNRRELARRH